MVITTVGLTGASTKFTNYDIDYQGNLSLLEAARADGVTNGPVKTVPAFMMDVLGMLPKMGAQGKSDVLKFSKFTLLNDCVGDTEVAGRGFRAYIAEKSYAPVIEAELAAKAAAEKGGER